MLLKNKTICGLLLAAIFTMTACGGSKDLQKVQGELDACKQAQAASAQQLEAAKAELDAERQAASKYRELLERRAAIDKALRDQLQELLSSGQLTINYRRGLMILELPNSVLFDLGKTEIKAEGQKAIGQIAVALKSVGDRRFLVAGHTDNTAISKKNEQFKSNWQLSSARAQVVSDLLIKQGVSPTTIGVTGFGEFDPVAENTDDAGRARNRRTEIVLVPNLEGVLPALDAKTVSLNQ